MMTVRLFTSFSVTISLMLRRAKTHSHSLRMLSTFLARCHTASMAQQGLFTVQKNPKEIFEHPSLQRWEIAPTFLIDFSVTIETLGVNHSTVFPDLDGLCRHIRNGWIRG